MRKYLLIAYGLASTCFLTSKLSAQLVINGGSITIGDNAFITVQGDLTSNADILGNGKIIMNGTSAQQMNLNGHSIPNLEMNSTGNVVLAGDTKVGSTLDFVNGKIQTGDFNLTLANNVLVTGAGTGKFVETNGTGQLRREITSVGTYVLCSGAGANYMPLQYQVSGGTVGAGAYVATTLVGTTHPKKPIRAIDNLPSYWKASYSGITGSTVTAVGTYVDGAGVNGNETLLNGIRYDGTNWSLANSAINTSSNTVTYNSVPASGTDLYAMDKFLLMNAKVFLQGAYNGSTMNDFLRAANVIPLSDPYRAAPYSTFFTHTNNPTVEVANSAVFADFANNDNIVDWVFLELRNSSGSLLQTRSALVQKDGDIVEIDGINPVAFLNLDPANYVISVRHRNHLGLSADLTNYQKALSVANPTAANKFDFTSATDAQIFGDATAYNTSGAVKLLWAGNANSNGSSRYTGPSNDHSYLLSTELAGNSSAVISGVYKSGDLNLNGNVRYTGPSNDHTFLLTNVLGGNSSAVISQQIITP